MMVNNMSKSISDQILTDIFAICFCSKIPHLFVFFSAKKDSNELFPTWPGGTRGGTSSKERGGQQLKNLFASKNGMNFFGHFRRKRKVATWEKQKTGF